MSMPELTVWQKFMAKTLIEHVNDNEGCGRVDCHCGFGPVTRQEWAEHVVREAARKLNQ